MLPVAGETIPARAGHANIGRCATNENSPARLSSGLSRETELGAVVLDAVVEQFHGTNYFRQDGLRFCETHRFFSALAGLRCRSTHPIALRYDSNFGDAGVGYSDPPCGSRNWRPEPQWLASAVRPLPQHFGEWSSKAFGQSVIPYRLTEHVAPSRENWWLKHSHDIASVRFGRSLERDAFRLNRLPLDYHEFCA